MNIRSVLVVPLTAQDGATGLLQLLASTPGKLAPPEALPVITNCLASSTHLKVAGRPTAIETIMPAQSAVAESIEFGDSRRFDGAQVSSLLREEKAWTVASLLKRAAVLQKHWKIAAISAVAVGLAGLGILYFRGSAHSAPLSAKVRQQTTSTAVTTSDVVSSAKAMQVPASVAKSRPDKKKGSSLDAGAPAPSVLDRAPTPIQVAPSSQSAALIRTQIAPDPDSVHLASADFQDVNPALGAQAMPKLAVRLSTGLQEGKLLFRVNPVYPLSATGRTGTVRLRARIGEDGRVVKLTLLESSEPSFTVAAKQAVEQWRYQPSTLNGVPTPIDREIEVRFK